MTKILSYRAVNTNDLNKICTFPLNEEELFFMFPKARYPLTIDQLEATINSRTDSTVILFNKKIVGFANFYEVKEKQYCSIGNVIVNSEFRNHGIGTFLIQTMEQIAIKKYNAPEIHISCFNTNTNGILLYSKLGYKPYDIEKWSNPQSESMALIRLKKAIR